jgi:hypothetical protein
MVRLNTRERFFCALYGKIAHKRKIPYHTGHRRIFLLCLILPYRAQKNLSLVFNLAIQGSEESFSRLNTRERFFDALYGKIKHKRKIRLCPVW